MPNKVSTMYRIITLFTLVFSLQIQAGEFAKQANDNPFLSGELNPQYEGELTALGGTVIDHIVVESNNVYKLDLRIEGIKPVWVTSFVKPEGKQKIERNDKVVFKGYISKSDSLDPTGKLLSAIESKTLLIAIYAQNQGI